MNRAAISLGFGLALVFLSSGPTLAKTSDAASHVVVRLSGMDCGGCNLKVKDALEALGFLGSVEASFAEQSACGELSGTLDEQRIAAAIVGIGYTFVSADSVVSCPVSLGGELPEPWAGRSEGLDVETISQGEEVVLEAHVAPGRFTLIDFGAAWCGPCHDAAERLRLYLGEHGDVSVRVVNLGGKTPDDSYQQPVVNQHLKYVKGIPWFLVYGPTGRVLARTQEVDKAIAAIDKHRARAAARKIR